MIKNIVLNSFRGMKNIEFSLGQKTHIVGRNGSGKTHVLDAIHLLTGAKNIYGNPKLENGDRIEIFFEKNFSPISYIFAADEKREFFLIQ